MKSFENPARAFQSKGFTEAAWTLTSNSPEPGVGRGASSNRSTSGLPKLLDSDCFDVCHVV
jgi:hypothetical protein